MWGARPRSNPPHEPPPPPRRSRGPRRRRPCRGRGPLPRSHVPGLRQGRRAAARRHLHPLGARWRHDAARHHRASARLRLGGVQGRGNGGVRSALASPGEEMGLRLAGPVVPPGRQAELSPLVRPAQRLGEDVPASPGRVRDAVEAPGAGDGTVVPVGPLRRRLLGQPDADAVPRAHRRHLVPLGHGLPRLGEGRHRQARHPRQRLPHPDDVQPRRQRERRQAFQRRLDRLAGDVQGVSGQGSPHRLRPRPAHRARVWRLALPGHPVLRRLPRPAAARQGCAGPGAAPDGPEASPRRPCGSPTSGWRRRGPST